MTIENMAMGKAITAGLRQAMLNDSKVLLMGEDIGRLGGVFRVTDGLHQEFGSNRVLDTPLAESGIVGTAIGLAMRGYRPVCEIQFDGFIYPAFDQITSQLAKLTSRHDGKLTFPVVIRVPYGGHIGAVEHKTGRVVVAQEAPGNVSLGSELAATIAEKAFYSLEAPVTRVSGFDVPFPPAKLEATFLPDADRILDAVDRVLSY